MRKFKLSPTVRDFRTVQNNNTMKNNFLGLALCLAAFFAAFYFGGYFKLLIFPSLFGGAMFAKNWEFEMENDKRLKEERDKKK